MAAKKTARKITKRLGRPKGSKNLKNPGLRKKKASRPRRKKAEGNSISIPVGKIADINFCSDLISFLNTNSGKSFTVLMDGTDYTLVAG